MANLDKDEVVAAFTEAYKKVNGKAPSIESKSGWYSVDGGMTWSTKFTQPS